jgi:tRNA nucleotidyltransferase/poly(A) polymerase
MTTSGSEQAPDRDALLRRAAIDVVRRLVDAGHEAYFAGGCVRDRLMGNEPADYDVATSATPDAVAGLFRKARSVGEAFGVMLVRATSFTVEIATFRTEGVYSDGRHPDRVEFSDARHDAERRDFTINGLFEDPLQERIIDYVGGQEDIRDGVIRAIGDPDDRMREDRLRMLRAVRFAARFGFSIEAGTADAIRRGAGDLAGVSRERIGQELKLMLTDPNRVVAAWEIQYLGLDETLLDEPARTLSPARLGRLPEVVPFATALAAWLLDRHATHDEELLNIARRWAGRLLLSNADKAAVLAAIRTYLVLTRDWSRLGVARQKRLAASASFVPGMLLVKTGDRQRFVDLSRQVSALRQTGLAPDPFINGDDLVALGLQPGPLFKQVLDAVYDAQLERTVEDRAAALALATALGQAAEGTGEGGGSAAGS